MLFRILSVVVDRLIGRSIDRFCYSLQRAEPAWKQMRWIEEAVQNGRDAANSGDSLLSVATIKKGIEKARTRHAQQQQDAERRREKEGEGMLLVYTHL